MNIAVLGFVLLMQGCAFNSFMFEATENKPIVIIEHPPNRIAFGGNLNDKDMENLQKVLGVMQKMPYRNHHYSSPLGVNVNAIVKSDRTSSFSGTTAITEGSSRHEKNSNNNTDVSTDTSRM